MDKNPGMFSSKTLISLDILDDMGVSKLSANIFLKVNYSLKADNGYIAILKTLYYFV